MNNIVKSVVFAAVVLFAGIAAMQVIYKNSSNLSDMTSIEPAAGDMGMGQSVDDATQAIEETNDSFQQTGAVDQAADANAAATADAAVATDASPAVADEAADAAKEQIDETTDAAKDAVDEKAKADKEAIEDNAEAAKDAVEAKEKAAE